jgi:hypothetical protein
MVHYAAAGSPRNAFAVAILFIRADTILSLESGTLASFMTLPLARVSATPDFSFLSLVEPWITAVYF